MLAQVPTASSDYTAALPSVEKVKTQLRGDNPTDTLARHVAVFTYLHPNARGSLVWDVPVNLVAGDNAVMFSSRNAEAVQ